MVKFRELGFSSFNEYAQKFFGSLLPSNKTYDYFVDWSKVRSAVNDYLEELSLLNSLVRVDADRRPKYLQVLLSKHPKIVEVIPLLVAERVRNGKINVFDLDTDAFLSFEFKESKVNKKTIPQIITFCIKTGIMDLFQGVKDISDYLLGVEVGLDTNARKNRSGDIFEKMCQQKINKYIRSKYEVVDNDPNFSLYPVVAEDSKSKGKRHDIVVYKNDKPVLVGEFNFYNTSGSKPVSIAESYVALHTAAKEQDIKFLWVTDGPAWHKMKQPLLLSMKKIDWLLNYRMLHLIKRILK